MTNPNLPSQPFVCPFSNSRTRVTQLSGIDARKGPPGFSEARSPISSNRSAESAWSYTRECDSMQNKIVNVACTTMLKGQEGKEVPWQ